jgi:N-methylhydantoinase A
MRLDEAAAERVIVTLAEALRQPLHRAAFAVMAVANENMIEAIKEITINEGVDPSEAVLVAGGGAAGLNIAPIAAELGCEHILVPRTAGALSASGMQFSDIVTEAGASRLTTSADFDFAGVNAALKDIGARLESFAGRLRERGVGDIEVRYYVEARYRFQVWELEIPVAGDSFDVPADVGGLVDAFHEMHERVFAVRDPEQPVEFLNWRGRLTGRVRAARLEPARDLAERTVRAERQRMAYFGDGVERVPTPVYVGDQLAPGGLIEGPAIVEEPTTTLVVYPGSRARISAGGRYLVSPPSEGEA